MVEINIISEIYPSQYMVILDSPHPLFLEKIIDSSHQYIWCFEHAEDQFEWRSFHHTIYSESNFEFEILSRNIIMEYLVETKDFVKMLPFVKQSLCIIQANKIPPYYLDMNKLKGQTRYDLLASTIDYLFEIIIPGSADYSPIISPNKQFLEHVIIQAKKYL